ncbi:hypothetical protein MXD62_14510 [Frankia sp. Mgl5]|nr:hypothetical protein [Frankia sp. Mgl5]
MGRPNLGDGVGTRPHAQPTGPYQAQQNQRQPDDRKEKQHEKRDEGGTHGCSSRLRLHLPGQA